MSTPESSSNWDLTPVIDLLQSFRVDDQRCNPTSAASITATRPLPRAVPAPLRQERNDGDEHQRLGDFAALWDFLGEPLSSRQHDCINGEKVRSLEVVEDNKKPDNTGLNNFGESQAAQKTKILRRPARAEKASKPVEESIDRTPKVVLSRPAEAHSHTVHVASTQQGAQTLKSLGFENGSVAKVSGRQNGSKDLLSPSKRRPQIQPIITGSEEDKRRDLISKLRTHCPNEGKVLSNPNLLDPAFCLSNNNSKGIHVFVDASNIMVGFHDYIKTTRNIPTTCRVPRLPLSFHNLSLVLERGRSVSKRVLVGSDRFPAIYEAEQLGYETNILDRVQKTKETPRKKKFLNGGDTSSGKATMSNCQDQSSESETIAGSQLPRWVEQAVDEILHLKMLETLVDTSDPSTIVLATGDAAEAEYSEGFMRMVERALEKKWRVELVSFRCTTSRAYRRKEFRAKWSSRFAIIELDPYAEYLLAM